ncbi:MAG: ABC transporter permease [Candidatus Heimdallarchaeota archaeon]
MRYSTNKALIIGLNNFKRKTRNWQNIFYMIGFPVMFTVIFYLMFGMDPIEGTDFVTYDISFPGMVIYATGLSCVSASIFFATEKKEGMLERLDSMPIGRKNLFLGFVLAESLFAVLSTIIIFLIGYGGMQVYFDSVWALIIGFTLAVIFGIQSVGIGIIIASFSKSGEAANGISMIYYMPVIFASGALIPFESSIVYATPPYWAKQVYFQLTVLGHSLSDEMYSSSLIGMTVEPICIPLWGGLLIFVGLTIGLLISGIILFQKKTQV